MGRMQRFRSCLRPLPTLRLLRRKRRLPRKLLLRKLELSQLWLPDSNKSVIKLGSDKTNRFSTYRTSQQPHLLNITLNSWAWWLVLTFPVKEASSATVEYCRKLDYL